MVLLIYKVYMIFLSLQPCAEDMGSQDYYSPCFLQVTCPSLLTDATSLLEVCTVISLISDELIISNVNI